MDEDIFAAALSLEDSYYNEGFTQGSSDGAKAGLYDGRHFGLTQAYSKFRSIGQLHGHAIVWKTRSNVTATTSEIPIEKSIQPHIENSDDAESTSLSPARIFLPQVFSHTDSKEAADNDTKDTLDTVDPEIEPPTFLQDSQSSWLGHATSIPTRARKQVTTLYALTEPESLALENTEDAVTDLEDRSKRAVAKAGLVGRMLGERIVDSGDSENGKKGKEGGEMLYAGASTGEGELEDIAGKGIAGKGQRIEGVKVDEPPDYDALEIEIH